MKEILLGHEDRQQIQRRGIEEKNILEQIALIQEGSCNVVLDRACTLGDGIVSIAEQDYEKYIEIYEKALEFISIVKFVPASGAASRMFEDWEKILPSLETTSADDMMRRQGISEAEKNFLLFAKNIKDMAFYKDLQQFFKKIGRNLEKSIDEAKWQDIIRHLLYSPGLDYIHTPKALIPFHLCDGECYTALEEQLYEGVKYAKDEKNTVRFHFTIASGQKENFQKYAIKWQSVFQQKGIYLKIEFSEQKLSTETIALDLQDELVREESGELLFRPAGHGALLENLDSIDADIVFIKNIDNVVPPSSLETTCLYKKLLAGYLLSLQSQVFLYLNILENDKESKKLEEMVSFAKRAWNIDFPEEFYSSSWQEQKKELFAIFHRPMRVCGMVRNQGEPGGGPFWTRDSRGKISKQIVEKSQIFLKSPEQKKILDSSTHFNPVDLVCAFKDYKGKKFCLKDYVDKRAAFLSQKPYRGMTIKALELPGLWNGSMAFWNTSFIEVPLATFNPVKKVTDLLRNHF
ncbi:MAG: DUF4301 family protein [Candidatus Brocadiae bacterium]|nr:DUF4301 family protein [Candidatus Brocadiia bacterium]